LYPCPHCGTETVSALRKLFLGQVKPTTCRSCAGKIATSIWGLLTPLPLLAAATVTGFYLDSLGLAIAALIVAAAIGVGMLLQLEVVPLVAYSRGTAIRATLLAVLAVALMAPCLGVPLGLHFARHVPTPESLLIVRRTEHFEIHTNLDDERKLDHYAKFFDGFVRRFEADYYPLEQKRRLRMFLFADKASYLEWIEDRYPGFSSYGFYLPEANAIVVNLESGLGTATHELVHHFVAVGFRERPPEWVNEGFATFFEKFIGHLDEGGKLEISFGYFSNWRFPSTKFRVERLDLAELTAARDVDQCAARSFFLFLHRKGLMKKLVLEMRRAEKPGNGLNILEKVYGLPTSTIEKDWKKWIRAQPLDDDVKLVEHALAMSRSEWQSWWQANRKRLLWDQKLDLYRVRPRPKTPRKHP
jgi:hypothetical protein